MQKREYENTCTSQSHSIYDSFEKEYPYECFRWIRIQLLSISVNVW